MQHQGTDGLFVGTSSLELWVAKTCSSLLHCILPLVSDVMDSSHGFMVQIAGFPSNSYHGIQNY